MTMALLKVILIWLIAGCFCCNFMAAVAFPNTAMIEQQQRCLRSWCPRTGQQEKVMVGQEMVTATTLFQLHQQNPLFSSKISLSGCKTKKVTIKSLVALRGGAAATAAVLSAISISSPPTLIKWIFPALLCALSYALYNIFIKKASATIDPLIGGVLLQIVAAMLGGLVLVIKRATTTAVAASTTTSAKAAGISRIAGLKWAAAAGLAVGMAELLSFIISGMGVQAAQSIPVVVGGSVLLGTVLGAVWLCEALTIKGWCGVFLIAVGIALVGIDEVV